MPFLLHFVNKNRWVGQGELTWVGDNDVPADPVTNLRTTDNELSVWDVAEGDEELIQRLVAAFAAVRAKVDKIDYLLLSTDTVQRLGMRLIRERGTGLPDKEICASHHMNLTELTGKSVCALVREILLSPRLRRIGPPGVAACLRQSIEAGHISEDTLSPKVRDGIAKHAPQS